MPTSGQITLFITLIFLTGILTFGGGCSQKNTPLVVYSGKGLKNAMEEIKLSFEQQEGIPVTITYAGSNSLLKTLKETHKGDIFIPGSSSFIKQAGDLVTHSRYVAHHTPAFIVQVNTSKGLKNYSDLLAPGVSLAVGNPDLCAIGRVGEAILNNAEPPTSFRSNIVVKGSTVNELLELVINNDVDAALIWSDMHKWKQADNLKLITIPDNLNMPKKIKVAALSVSEMPQKAAKFVDFVATKGQSIFVKHGFGKK